ncbi:MAG: hypothetical protein Q8L86_03875 [Vicinamibacterales bacterium]|nr:hypothetical protein [Vicinamibacterales bacterium]
MTVIFRVAAGPRQGFGHLRRAVSLARALGVAPRVSVRGTPAARRAARRLGCRVEPGAPGATLDRAGADLLVIDDPRAWAGHPWLAAARRRGIPVASVHDLGLQHLPSDLVIDGSLTFTSRDTARGLFGPRFAVLDPRLARAARWRPRRGAPRVLVTLGGGPRRGVAARVAHAIRQRCPGAIVRVTGGFVPGARATGGIVDLPPLPHLGGELAAAAVAVVSGGVSLYEACALGTPTVAVSVVSGQRRTVRTGADLGGVVFGGHLTRPGGAAAVAAAVSALLTEPKRQQILSSRGRALVDGRGALRIARRLRQLARKRL